MPQALGGRLGANILCLHHNTLIGGKCDDPMIAQLSPLMFMLGTPRGRGAKFASLQGKSDSGDRLVVRHDWKVERRRIDQKRIAPSGKIEFVKGELSKLDELRAQGAFENENGPVIATLEKPPIVNFDVAIADAVHRGVLKIALHFVASFVADVNRAAATALLPYILGAEAAIGKHVHSLPLAEMYFPESWPPRHDIRTYPVEQETFVTVLLFGVYGFHVRLPIATTRPIRYKQELVDSVKWIFEANDHLRSFQWGDRLTDEVWEALKINLQFRFSKIEGLAKWRMAKDRCHEAADRAVQALLRRPGDPWQAYRDELQMAAFSEDEIIVLLHFGRRAVDLGRPPWELPLEEYITS